MVNSSNLSPIQGFGFIHLILTFVLSDILLRTCKFVDCHISMHNYHKYLAVTPVEEAWGFYVTTIGYSRTDPNQAYPDNKKHPLTHSFTWNKGRILNGYYLVFISRGQG